MMNTLAKLRNRMEIARLRAVVPFQLVSGTQEPVNRVDAALAALNDSGRDHGDIDRICYGGVIRGVADSYRMSSTAAAWARPACTRWDALPGRRKATSLGSPARGRLTYPTGKAFFAGQLLIEGTPDNGGLFSNSGDSGSAILNDQHELVGLLFAGSERQTLANPIADVMRELQATSGLTLHIVTG